MADSRRVLVIRHGQTLWSESGQHTGITDIDLTAEGEQQARALVPLLRDTAAKCATVVWSSPALRARRTAELAGVTPSEFDEDLREWNYGEYEARTTEDIRQSAPGWDIWTQGAPGGESPEQITARADRVVARARQIPAGHDLIVFCHGHFGRVFVTRFLGMPVDFGRHIEIYPASVTTLGYTRDETPTLLGLNHIQPRV